MPVATPVPNTPYYFLMTPPASDLLIPQVRQPDLTASSFAFARRSKNRCHQPDLFFLDLRSFISKSSPELYIVLFHIIHNHGSTSIQAKTCSPYAFILTLLKISDIRRKKDSRENQRSNGHYFTGGIVEP